MSESTVVAVVDSAPTSSIRAYTSIVAVDLDTRIALFSAVATSEVLDGVLGKPIMLKHVVIEPTEFTNEVTGVVSIEPRVTLITADGASYRGTSLPLHRDITRLLAIAGEPSTWERPIELVIVKEGKAPQSYLTIKSAK